jgi:hypothetical protein
MKKQRFTEEQIVGFLKQAGAGVAVADSPSSELMQHRS